jgi:subtilisin family serine protease
MNKERELFYYRGKTKVSFEPRRDLLAASVQPDFSEEQDKELLEYGSQLKLQHEKVGAAIREDNVRVFRFPPDTSEQDKVEIQKRLTEQPMIRHVGPVIHLDDRGISFMTNKFVVKYTEPISLDEVNAMVKPYNLEVIRQIPYSPNAFVLMANAPASYKLLDHINELAENEGVEYAEPNLVSTAIVFFTPNDFLFSSQPHHQVINSECAWDIARGNQDIIVAVVDSGCDFDHPEFVNDSSLGWDKVYEQFDFGNMSTDPTGGTHGTKSCGIATANADNSEGVAGVAPGCRLMPIRWPSGTEEEWADMYVWIAGFDPGSTDPDFPDPINPGADVISNSIGVKDNPISSVMRDAFDYITDHGRDGKGCVILFAAGNDDQDLSTHDFCQWAAYDRTIAVASSAISPPDASEVKVSTSNFGAKIDVCAPGGGPGWGTEARTLSTTNVGAGDTAGSTSATTNDYDDFGQTSCACPQVAGVAALMLSVNPDLTWDQVRQIIRDTADPIDVGNTDPVGQWVDTDGDGVADFSQWYGYGRLDAERAVEAARDHRPVALRAHNGQYVCAEGGGGREVVANRSRLATWETFQLIDLGNNNVALRAYNAQFVCAEGGGGREVVANRDHRRSWETFKLVHLGGNKVALRAHNGQYVCAEGGGGQEVVANRDQIGPWEMFQLVDLRPEYAVALRVYNDQFMCAEGGGGQALVANRDRIDRWETFDLVNLGDNKVALRAHHGQYVCAEDGGGREVMVNRHWIGSWEAFELFDLGNGDVALRADNGQYVCAEDGGGREVVANRNSRRGWEMFQLIGLWPAYTVALRAHNGQYVCAEGGGGRELVANRDRIDRWETFELVDLGDDKVALRAYNGQYVAAEGGGGGQVMVNRHWIGGWETFEYIDLGNDDIALRAHNAQFICAEGGGGGEVVADRDLRRGWETFKVISLRPGRRIALQAHNGQYVCAEGGGGREVVANRDWRHAWETFELVDLRNDKVALRAHNGQYVCAAGGGGRELVVNRDWIGSWETFELIGLEGSKVALKAHNGQYVCAVSCGWQGVTADSSTIGNWETFKIVDV